MKSIITTLAALSITGCAIAQDRGFGRNIDDTGPYSEQQAQLMSRVWGDIREAASFEQIDWDSVGLDYAPGDARARRIMADNWGTLRQAANFEDIDWETSTSYRDVPSFSGNGFADGNPFTAEESRLMSAVWPEIREADDYEEIDWRDAGLDFAPGDAEARATMREHWDALRQAAEFEDIDWAESTAYDRSRDFYPDEFEERGPFTREEAQLLSIVWPDIRVAGSFDDIDWRSVGLSEPPGDAAARRFVREHWGELRQQRDFRDIDWERIAG